MLRSERQALGEEEAEVEGEGEAAEVGELQLLQKWTMTVRLTLRRDGKQKSWRRQNPHSELHICTSFFSSFLHFTINRLYGNKLDSY